MPDLAAAAAASDKRIGTGTDVVSVVCTIRARHLGMGSRILTACQRLGRAPSLTPLPASCSAVTQPTPNPRLRATPLLCHRSPRDQRPGETRPLHPHVEDPAWPLAPVFPHFPYAVRAPRVRASAATSARNAPDPPRSAPDPPDADRARGAIKYASKSTFRAPSGAPSPRPSSRWVRSKPPSSAPASTRRRRQLLTLVFCSRLSVSEQPSTFASRAPKPSQIHTPRSSRLPPIPSPPCYRPPHAPPRRPPLLTLLTTGCGTIALVHGAGDGGGIPVAGCDPSAPSTRFISCVLSFEPGAGAGYGQDDFPAVIYGPPIAPGGASSQGARTSSRWAAEARSPSASVATPSSTAPGSTSSSSRTPSTSAAIPRTPTPSPAA